MWSFALNAFANIGVRKSSFQSLQAELECSDDGLCSNSSREEEEEEGLECPVCWESFNIVENVPYVLWCGHTLCENCVLGLQCTALRKVKLPLFISCPWCHSPSLRLLCKGKLKYPRKNFFVLWMVERLNGNRSRFSSTTPCVDTQPIWSPKGGDLLVGTRGSNATLRRVPDTRCLQQADLNGDDGYANRVGRYSSSIHKSIDFFFHLMSKLPLMIVFLLLLFLAVPGSAVVLLLYLLITIFFAIPSSLVLYFAYPTLSRLMKEILS
ncbi:hypothetical protein Tsubulata_050329 [Turnera subulata]|uniref:RING-type domain-containing protein n=1 Tax=Turnera subulata TaxID=218843 RepID=A0A9Q0FC66_9ROSI|nr:hypothetical protein Tsubulata_050329 [Turnera subulata]